MQLTVLSLPFKPLLATTHRTTPRRAYSTNVNHYAVLGLSEDATEAAIKQAYLKIAKETHPDVSDSPVDANTFKAASAAHELLMDQNERAKYDQLHVKHRPKPTNPHAATARAKSESPFESEMRSLIASDQVDEAIKKWARFGASLPLLISILGMCTRSKRLPSDLTDLLDALHASDPASLQTDSAGSQPLATSGSVQAFVERKTKAYNDLIRLCDICGTREQLFEVLDEMEANKIDVDMETWMVLEEIFTLGTKRPAHNKKERNPRRRDS